MARGASQVKVITSVGKTLKLSNLCGLLSSPVKVIAVGTGNTADAAVGDTALIAEVTDSGLVRVAVVPTVVAGVATWSYTFTATAAKVIAEIGLFSADTPGTLYMHITTGSTTGNDITLAIGDTFKVTVTDTE
jgi:hypothetical protein